MENQEYEVVNVSITLMIKPGSLKYLIPSIEQGMQFEEKEGILYFEYETESDAEE